MLSIKTYIKLLYSILICGSLLANADLSKQEYRLKYEQISINHQLQYGIPASITLAQGILESNSGNSILAKKRTIILELNVTQIGMEIKFTWMMTLQMNVFAPIHR